MLRGMFIVSCSLIRSGGQLTSVWQVIEGQNCTDDTVKLHLESLPLWCDAIYVPCSSLSADSVLYTYSSVRHSSV